MGQISAPAEVISPCDILNLLNLARREKGTRGLASRQVCMALVDAMRFTHRARTRVLYWDTRLIVLEYRDKHRPKSG